MGSLVEHTAGLPRVLPSQAHAVGDPYAAWTADRVDREVLPELGRLIEESGGRDVDVGYSNLGYAVLTRVVELRTGRPWIELLRERVVTPLGVAAEAVTLDPTGLPRGVVAQRARAATAGLERLDRPVLRGRWPVRHAPGHADAAVLRCRRQGRVGPPAIAARMGRPGPALLPPGGAHALRKCRGGDVDTGRIAVAHAVGGLPGRGAHHAQQALTELLTSATDSAQS